MNEKKIIDRYKPIVFSLAKKIYKSKQCPLIDFDDVVSAGFIGLLEAEKNKTNDHPPIRYYYRYIRGTILNEYLKYDLPYHIRHRCYHHLQQTETQLIKKLNRQPLPAETHFLFDATRNINTPNYHKTRQYLNHAKNICCPNNETDNQEFFITQEDTVHNEFLKEQLIQKINALSAQEKKNLYFYYCSDFTLKKIMRILAMKKSTLIKTAQKIRRKFIK